MPTSEDPLAVWLADASREMEGQDGERATLAAAVRLAVGNIDGAESASVSIVSGRKIVTPAWEGDVSLESDRLQYELNEGPCLDSIAEHHAVHSPSLAYDQRWPSWGPRVVEEQGAHSVLSVRLFTDGQAYGALNMYSKHKDAFSDQDQEEATALAAHVAIALAAVRESDSLLAGLDSRSVIGQAMGVVMERFDLTPPVALALLSRISAGTQTKVRDVARQIVATRTVPTGVEPADPPQS